MKKPAKTVVAKVSNIVDYKVMTLAIANAALSRRAALQIEMAVSLIHFTQENGGTDSTGKANLKAVYHGAGYTCLTKADRDYKTVNRRLNAMAKLFDKIGSSLVHSWIEEQTDTEAMINTVVAQLAAYGWDTLDDVLAYVDVDTSRVKKAPAAAPVVVTEASEGEEEGAAPAAAPAAPDLDVIYAMLTSGYGPEMLREFCSRVMVHIATVETVQEQTTPLQLVA